ncbi:Uncharacterised protein [Candidatus Bartonella washoeensis]|uniref:Uncharacterized protein n=1 Tax=Candidatus Bartonella washoeensis Sb944nv TaxID=1094563 RepID=J1J1H0_9HYPH|nr:hypothetical protein [Bartonella washoeensis]EJF77430.1 hypothetical protein MCQ_01514 [Bartonella washoeensis Sb944nv]SPU26564.1 Uncharacterised protein [Bartonella washoeensis]
MSLVAVVISLICNVISFYAVHDSSKRVRRLRKELAEKNELIASQKALMEGQLAENEKKIKRLQELQEKVQERLTEYGQSNPEKQECLMSYENIYENLQVPEDVRALVREFLEHQPVKDELDDRSQKILQQLMRDEQTKHEAIKVVRAFEEWFTQRRNITFAQCYYWSRAQNLLCHLFGVKPMTWEDLAKKTPEEQQRYMVPGKIIVD